MHLRRLWWVLLALLCLLAPLRGAWALACSPYMGQAKINELRVGKSNKNDAKNQIELFNNGNVPQAVWSTWQLEVYFKQNGKSAVRKGGYYLSTNTTAAGQFIFTTRSKKMFLRNKNLDFVDVALLDANGDLIDYLAIEGVIQTPPGCFGMPAVVDVTSSSDAEGNVSRLPDGGTWPAVVSNTGNYTIGATNVCTAGGSDLYISHNSNISTPVATKTEIAYTTTVTNLSCSATVSGITVTVTGIDDRDPGGFSGLSKNTTQGSTTSVNTSPLVWTVGSLAPGTTATLTVTGKPRSVGTINSTATITAPATGLINTGNDSDSETVAVQLWNWVGFEIAADTAIEGQVSNYAARVTAAVIPSNNITINYSVSGTATASDTNLSASGTLLINKDDLNDPDSTSIDFTITNDLIPEPTKNLILTITSVISGDNMVKFDSGSALFTPAMNITLLDDDGPDHYELSLPTTGLACLASTVTVQACNNASSPCNSPYLYANGYTATLSSSGATLAATTLSFNASGVASTTLSYPLASNGSVATVTLSGEQRLSVNPRQCCPNGSACATGNSCSITFSSAGLIITSAVNGAAATLPTTTAGTTSPGYFLRAVKTNTTTKACEAALSGANSVNWAYQCNNPASCSAANLLSINAGTATSIQRNNSGATPAYTAVAMTFDANGNAPFAFSFGDVGQITLLASKTVATAPLSGASNSFVSRPSTFSISAVAQTAAPMLANPAAASATGARFVKAGEAFSATVTALTSSGATTPNFGRESPAEGTLLTASLLQPAGGSAGTLANASIAGSSFVNGVAAVGNLSYSEVGIISLAASVADADYLGTGQVTGTASANVGRFVPSRFTLNAGAAAGGCGTAFTYFGQDGFSTSFTLRAENSLGTATQNYSGSFAKLSLSNWAGYGFSAPGLPAGALLAASATAPSGTWLNGQATVTARHQVSRPTSPAAQTDLVVWAETADSDGVTLASSAIAPAAALRSGRLRLSNAFGSASAPLQLPVFAEYWSGSSWVLNSADSCTTLPAASVALSNPRNAYGAVSSATSSASAITLAAGQGLLSLAAPLPAGSSLSLDLAINLGSTAADQSCQAAHPASTGAARPWLRSRNGSCTTSWDRDPAARASFGLYSPETRRTVHARELF